MPRSNSTVKAHYKLQHTTLGEGGFAKVKLARTKSVRKRDVAVKIASLKDKDAQREAELLAFLGDHPNVCHLLDCKFFSSFFVFWLYETRCDLYNKRRPNNVWACMYYTIMFSLYSLPCCDWLTTRR